jgi:multiple sugar transport system permease protein
MSSIAIESSEMQKKKKGLFKTIYTGIKKNFVGYLFISPVLLGILIFTLLPMAFSLYYSFFDYNVISPPINMGFQNYVEPFTTHWSQFSKSLSVTLIYTVVTIPMGLTLSYLLALFLNQKLKGMGIFRVIYYIPCIIPTIVGGLLWSDVTNYTYGIGNAIIHALGFAPYGFFRSPQTALPTFIGLSLFGLGGSMILWIAQLKAIPEVMYEAANIEGANWFVKLKNITIPMSTPMIFFMLIMGIIGCFQVFSSAFVVAGAGPNNALLFYITNVYLEAFRWTNMGYACALSWILFAIIAILSIIVFKTNKWVNYGEDF